MKQVTKLAGKEDTDEFELDYLDCLLYPEKKKRCKNTYCYSGSFMFFSDT